MSLPCAYLPYPLPFLFFQYIPNEMCNGLHDEKIIDVAVAVSSLLLFGSHTLLFAVMAFKFTSLLDEHAMKIRPMIALLFITSLSVLLVWQRTQTSIGAFRDAVMDNPGTTSCIKQLIAFLLGALWIYVAGSIFNLTTRLRLAGDRKPTLLTLNIWVALGLQRIRLQPPYLLYIFDGGCPSRRVRYRCAVGRRYWPFTHDCVCPVDFNYQSPSLPSTGCPKNLKA